MILCSAQAEIVLKIFGSRIQSFFVMDFVFTKLVILLEYGKDYFSPDWSYFFSIHFLLKKSIFSDISRKLSVSILSPQNTTE